MVVVVSVSFAAPLFRFTDAPPVAASAWRMLLAVLLLAPWARGALPVWRGWGRREGAAVLGAGIALGLHFALWVTSLEYTTVAASTALVTLQAVFVAVGGHLLGDRLGRLAWTGVLVAVAGAVAIAAGDGPLAGGSGRALLGDGLALAGGLGSALYLLVGRRMRAHTPLVAYVLPVYAVAAATLLALLPATGQSMLAGVGRHDLLVFVLLAAVPMLGGHTMANWTIRYLPAHVVATWILLEPVGAAILAWLLLQEVPGWWVVAGGAVVLLGAALTVHGRIVASEPAG